MRVPHVPTKSGLMLGLREMDDEVEVMHRQRHHAVDMLTLGPIPPSIPSPACAMIVHPDLASMIG